MAKAQKQSSGTTKSLLNKRASLLAEISGMTDILHGSWVERYSTCSRKDCDCHTGARHGPRFYVVVLEEGRQRQKYVPNSQVDAAKSGIARAGELQKIVREVTTINIELLRRQEYTDAR